MLKQIIFTTSLLLSVTMIAAEIQIPAKPTGAESSAAKELQEYLKKITKQKIAIVNERSPKSTPVFYVGKTECAKKARIDFLKMHTEQWVIKSVSNGILLTGGDPRGIMYAVYRYLEDSCGVRWWNIKETHIPSKKLADLPVKGLDRSGKPLFVNREFYHPYAHDDGAFLNRSQFSPALSAKSTTQHGFNQSFFGPPNGCHTFSLYFPPAEYFKKHPEWYALVDGKRVPNQPCLSNKDVRRETLKKLRAYIAQGKEEARANGYLPPMIYDLSQNDDGAWCECEKCTAINDREESTAGILIDYINEIANAIAKEHPEILISTFSYLQTEKAPKHIKAAKNVLVVFCDVGSDMSKPLTHKDNKKLLEKIVAWTKTASHVRIWDYLTTYKDSQGFPFPSEYTYASDLQTFHKLGIHSLFLEFEFPVLGDARDYKVWLLSKLLQDPYADFNALSKTFAHGYYGPAGDLFLQYRRMVKDACKNPVAVTYDTQAFVYLDLDFMQKAHALFDRGEKLLAKHPLFLKRWKHARLNIDRATLLRKNILREEYQRRHNTQKGYPFDTAMIAKRIEDVWMDIADERVLHNWRSWENTQYDKEKKLYTLPFRIDIPEKFKKIPRKDLFIIEPELTHSTSLPYMKFVKDPEAPSGVCRRLTFGKDPNARYGVNKYTFPMEWGVYDRTAKKNLTTGKIYESDIPKAGYNWICLGETTTSPSAGAYMFWSWFFGFNVAPLYSELDPHRTYEVWINIKFSGPAFPHGKKTEENSISMERVVLIRKYNN